MLVWPKRMPGDVPVDAGLEEDYERVSGMKLTAAEIAVAAEASDIVAENIIQVFEDRLGRATATIISLLDPRTIILGGNAPLPDRLCERVPTEMAGLCPD